MRSRPTLVGAMLVRRGDADAMLCGTLRQLRGSPELRPQRDRPARRREDAGGDADADAARPAALHLRHARQSRSRRRADRRDDAARRRGGAALRREAERRAAVAFELRQLGRAVGAEDARCAGDHPRARRPDLAVEGEMRADAALSKTDSRPRVSRLAPDRPTPTCWSCRTSTPPTSPTTRCASTAGRRHHGRRDPARRGQAGAHHDAIVDGAAHRQHDGGGGGRRRCASEKSSGRSIDCGARDTPDGRDDPPSPNANAAKRRPAACRLAG